MDQSSAGKLFLKKCDYSCKLELKFARQTGVPIVPVMMENRAAGWKPSDWLGVITAGALWTPLFSEADFETNITSLVSQVQASVGSTTVEMLSSDSSADREEEEEEEQEESSDFSVPEMRQELERLRADSEKSGAHQTTMDGEECTLPAMIPETHDGMVVSDSMHTLVDTVISATSKRRCGFWGTGGIGKTTTSAWLCRQRREFTSNPPLRDSQAFSDRLLVKNRSPSALWGDRLGGVGSDAEHPRLPAPALRSADVSTHATCRCL